MFGKNDWKNRTIPLKPAYRYQKGARFGDANRGAKHRRKP
jgi:hypothetical protein